MRKCTILIVLGSSESISGCIEYLKEQLKPSRCSHDNMLINGYKIIIMQTLTNYCRGYRPEITYINKDIYLDIDENIRYDNWTKTEMYSNRKVPVRLIGNYKDIDIKELLDDEYAISNTIDTVKLNKWNTNFRK